MLSKRTRGYSSADLPPEKRLRANLADMFASNEISGARARDVINDAVDAQALGLGGLRRLGSNKNVNRNLMRRLAKSGIWPPDYIAEVRTWNRKTHEATTSKIPMLLPHELIAKMCSRSSSESLFSRISMDPCTSAQLSSSAERLKIPRELSILGLSIWIDGVTCKWDRSESVDIISLGFPGLPDPWRNLRLPICAIDHCWVLKGGTFDDILKVIVWSLDFCAMNRFPSSRHDGTAWLETARSVRRKSSGGTIGCAALLCHVVGDWKC